MLQLLDRLSVRLKILIIPLVGVLGFAIYLVINYNVTQASKTRLQQVESIYFPILEKADQAQVLIDDIADTLRTAVAAGEAEKVKVADQDAAKVETLLGKIIAQEPVRKADATKIAAQFKAYYQSAKGVTMGMISGTTDYSKIGALVEKMKTDMEQLKANLGNFREQSHQLFANNITDSIAAAQTAMKTGLVLGGITMVLLVLTALFITTQISNNLQKVAQSFKDIASGEGDLTQRIKQTSKDEIGDLVYWFNSFLDKLQNIIGEVVRSIAPLTNTSHELSELANKSQQVSATQLESTEKVNDSIEHMHQSLNDNAANASHAAESAHTVDEQANQGKAVVNQTVASIQSVAQEVETAMVNIHQLEADTQNVGSILGVIQDIAAKTNLLALNAAIEAARAGEQGRGFAVVADEVRSLASRTQESTEEIHKVIEQLRTTAGSVVQVMEKGQHKTEEAVVQANKAGESLVQIAEGVDRITHLNMDIANATENQQKTSANIHTAASDIREKSESVACYSNDVADATRELQQISSTLQSIAKQFKV